MISLAVSLLEQKYGGDLHHPIWSEFGMTSSMSSIDVGGVMEGNTYAKLRRHACLRAAEEQIFECVANTNQVNSTVPWRAYPKTVCSSAAGTAGVRRHHPPP